MNPVGELRENLQKNFEFFCRFLKIVEKMINIKVVNRDVSTTRLTFQQYLGKSKG